MNKKILISIIAIMLIFVITGNVLGTSTSELNSQKTDINEQITNAQEQQQQIKEELSETMKEIEKLNKSIAESEEQLEELTDNLKQLEEQIDETQEKLDEAEENYNKQEELLKTRLIAQYKSGKTSYLDVLLNSSSITEFISKFHYVTIIAQKDTDLLNEIQAQKEEIEKAKKELEEIQSEYKIKKANAEKQNVILKNNQALKESYVEKLNDDERELQNQIDTYTSELKKIDAAIKKAEQEEAARQALAAQQTSGGSSSTTSPTNYVKYTGGTMAWPTRITKRVNSVYAPYGRSDTYGYAGSAHRGVDIYAPYGTPLYAAADGQVIYVNKSGWGGGYGLYVVISHGNGIYTLYGHGSSVPSNIDVGTTVTTDTVILYAGATGAAEGAHLHFEVWEGRNNRVNPCPYLGIENKTGYVQ